MTLARMSIGIDNLPSCLYVTISILCLVLLPAAFSDAVVAVESLTCTLAIPSFVLGLGLRYGGWTLTTLLYPVRKKGVW